MPENLDPLAEQLRAAVERRADALPPAPDMPDRIGARVRRRRRQRLALGSSVVVVVVALLATSALVVIPGVTDDGDEVQTAGRGESTTSTAPEPTVVTDDTMLEPSPPATTAPPTTDLPQDPTPPSTTVTAPSIPDRAVTADTPLTMDGIAPIRAGMTVYEAERAGSVTINVSASLEETGGTCNTGMVGDTEIWVLLQLSGASGEDQKDGIITVVSDARSTAEGLRMGDPIDRATEIYGDPTRTTEYPYVEGGQVLVYEEARYAYGVVTDGATVLNLQSGLADTIPTIEGCS